LGAFNLIVVVLIALLTSLGVFLEVAIIVESWKNKR
jgi:hypothetical protein